MTMEIPLEREHRPVHEDLFEVHKGIALRAPYIPEYKDFLDRIGEKKHNERIERLNMAGDECFLGFSSLNYAKENMIAPRIMPISYEGGRLRPRSRIMRDF